MGLREGRSGFPGHALRLATAVLAIAVAATTAGCSGTGQEATATSAPSAGPTTEQAPSAGPAGDRTTSRYAGKVCDLLDPALLWSALAGPLHSDVSPVLASDGPRAAWFAEAGAICYGKLQDGSGVQLIVNVLTTDGKRNMAAEAMKYGERPLAALGDDGSFHDHIYTAYKGNRQVCIVFFDTKMTTDQENTHAITILRAAIQQLPS